MNIQGCPAANLTNINNWKNILVDRTLIDGIGGFKGGEKEVTFHSVQAERNYSVSVCASSDENRLVDVNVTAETGRKNIFSRMVGAIVDAFQRLDPIGGMKVFETRAHQMKSKLENDILNQAMDAACREDADKETIKNAFKAATQFNKKFGIDEVDNEHRLRLATFFSTKYKDKSLLLQLGKELQSKIKKFKQSFPCCFNNDERFYLDQMYHKLQRIIQLLSSSKKFN
ncbi:hypothetical protein [Endozoicomonas sp. SESOKO4]|uniref:hypothetical protein n=1 Tax=Endozoicomonas sp. SESOKO4 TaxID=2828745 RepID=UPI002148CC4A|nr:hypothetical protein [Endozoicomonas sp. SESOKO4]